MNAIQRKALLQIRINALQALVDDIYFSQAEEHYEWLKVELEDAKHCMEDKHYL